MKISKRQLRLIIKEEKVRLLTEDSIQGVEERLHTAIDEYVMVMDEELGYDIPLEQLKAEVLNMVDGVFEQLERDQDDPERNY